MEKLRILKIVALLLLIFVGGAVAGILLDRHYAPRAATPRRLTGVPAPERADSLLKEFTAVMKLTPEQQQPVGAMLREWSKVIATHPEWSHAQRVSLMDSNSPFLRTNFTAEQSVLYDRLLEKMRRRPRR
jgi:hypothetical protein